MSNTRVLISATNIALRPVLTRSVPRALGIAPFHTTSTKQANAYDKVVNPFERNEKLGRPISPHLTIYNLSGTFVSTSIFHRYTGLALGLSFSSLFALYAVAPFASASAVAAAASAPLLLGSAKLLGGASFGYKVASGLRHLWFDYNPKVVTNEVLNSTAYVLFGTAALTGVGFMFL
ncbi:hypothetical protein M427DRAFT_294976 [Gonapodya prolifera JEL478]|uniref:Cytochrome b560 subunit of succinate dehydrogenase n=1 Tax=Gonapodya prolifera (strain JEL478) TaxID=1344416 RepID=A0A139AHG0_GONPJ|nr:hypothetical protein M427DRAFT_294976 [Gonapodya prolifera JEL478]|eukprot:KXS16237.1 hypothetical protein M427DRAFT_294976 [Gonapodya prolifera JEL478]